MDLRGFERLLERQVRQHGRDALRQHRLSGTRGSDHQRVVPARGRDFKTALDVFLALDVLKIHAVGGDAGEDVLHRDREGRVFSHPVEDFHGLPQGLDRVHGQPQRHGGLLRVLLRKQNGRHCRVAHRDRNRKPAAYGPDLAVQRQFAQHHRIPQFFRVDLSAGRKYADSHGQVVGGPLLPDVCGSQVHRDPLVRQVIPGVPYRRAHPLLGFLDCAVRKPHGHESG